MYYNDNTVKLKWFYDETFENSVKIIQIRPQFDYTYTIVINTI